MLMMHRLIDDQSYFVKLNKPSTAFTCRVSNDLGQNDRNSDAVLTFISVHMLVPMKMGITALDDW